MRFAHRFSFVLSAWIASVIILSASYADARTGDSVRTQGVSFLPAEQRIYVSVVSYGFGGLNAIYVLNGMGDVVETLQGPAIDFDGPTGLSVTNDPATLYVAMSANFQVAVFGNDSSLQRLDDIDQPLDVAVDGRGNVAAMNYYGTVACFNGGARTPTRVIYGPSSSALWPFTRLDWGAFDANGNLFVDGTTENNAVMFGEIVGGCVSGNAITPLRGMQLANAGAVQITKNSDIAVLNASTIGHIPLINTYRLTGNTLQLESVTPLIGAVDPVDIALTDSASVLTVDASLRSVSLYRYPSGGPPLKTVDLPGGIHTVPVGIAAYPSEQY